MDRTYLSPRHKGKSWDAKWRLCFSRFFFEKSRSNDWDENCLNKDCSGEYLNCSCGVVMSASKNSVVTGAQHLLWCFSVAPIWDFSTISKLHKYVEMAHSKQAAFSNIYFIFHFCTHSNETTRPVVRMCVQAPLANNSSPYTHKQHQVPTHTNKSWVPCHSILVSFLAPLERHMRP